MSQAVTGTRRPPIPLNGVDTPSLLATINLVKGAPELGRFQFRTRNTWIRGTQSRSRIESYSGAGGEHAHARVFEYDADQRSQPRNSRSRFVVTYGAIIIGC
jgi:hypothetical protein